MTTAPGAVAPEGSVWARDGEARWHALRVAELTDAGGAYRRLVRSVCGDWASVSPRTPGHWAEIAPRLPATPQLCTRCLEAEPAIEEAFLLAYAAPTMAQGRLF